MVPSAACPAVDAAGSRAAQAPPYTLTAHLDSMPDLFRQLVLRQLAVLALAVEPDGTRTSQVYRSRTTKRLRWTCSTPHLPSLLPGTEP
jgi:hypothetical protein